MEVLGSEVAGQYRGVRKRKWMWVSEIRVPGKKTRIWLGSFESPEMAAVAHDVAALRLRDRDARLNFPGLVDRFRRPATADPGDIRAAAKEAAAQVRFRPDLVRPAAGPVVGGDDVAWDALLRVCEELATDSPQMWAELADAMLLPPPIWNCNPADAVEWADGSLWDSPVWHY